jgi:two-component system, OmpR family, response regulator
MRLLIAEDDADLRQVLSDLLQQSGYSVDKCSDGTAALSALLTGQYALGIVDIGLPGLSGLELVRALRNRGASIPILIVTARDALNDRVGGLDAGADDYLVKPFDLQELQARVRALLRRQEVATPCALWPSSHTAASASPARGNAAPSQRRPPAVSRVSHIAAALSATALA